MSATRPARFPMILAAVYAAVAVGLALFGVWGLAGGFGALSILLVIASLVIHLRFKHHNGRKSNGRYRKALEAHRVGAGRRAGKNTGTRAHRDAVRTGAGMNPNPYPFGSRQYWAYESAYAGYAAMAPGPSPLQTKVAQPTARTSGDFDGKEADFVAGVVTGTRSFGVDKLGRLLGVTYPSIWVPGENEAKCLRLERDGMIDSYSYIVSGGTAGRTRVRESDLPAHSLTGCAHGFYGYYEGSNDFYEPGRVMGVVEAYGETIVGTRGFRASKARIVALHIPEDVAVGKRHLIVRNYPGVPIFDSFDAMISEFPPDDAGNGVGPATDPDFWTRQVES